MARVTVKSVSIDGVEFIASIASNDENNLRSAYLTPKFVLDANLNSDHPDFYDHFNSEVEVCRLVDASDEEIAVMIDEKVAILNSNSLESFF